MMLCKKINKTKVKLKIIGIRQGEKVHEEMITSMDSHNCYSFKEYLAILEKSNKKSIN